MGLSFSREANTWKELPFFNVEEPATISTHADIMDFWEALKKSRAAGTTTPHQERIAKTINHRPIRRAGVGFAINHFPRQAPRHKYVVAQTLLFILCLWFVYHHFISYAAVTHP